MAIIGGHEILDRPNESTDQLVVSVHELEFSMYKKSQPRTLAQFDPSLVAGSSGLLSRSLLSTLRSEDTGVTLESGFSVAGSEAELLGLW